MQKRGHSTFSKRAGILGRSLEVERREEDRGEARAEPFDKLRTGAPVCGEPVEPTAILRQAQDKRAEKWGLAAFLFLPSLLA